MTNKQGPAGPTPSDIAGERIRELRRDRGQSVAELAQACAEAGHPELTRDAIYTIETGRRIQGRRRRAVSVDELLAFAVVFQVPVWRFLPPAFGPSGEIDEAKAYIEKMLFEVLPTLERWKVELQSQAEQGSTGAASVLAKQKRKGT